MFRLPVSGMEVTVRLPAGGEDLLLAETPSLDTRLALELVRRLAHPVGRAAIEWSELSVTDLEALLLTLRESVFGGTICTDIECSAPACGARIDIFFRIGDYLEHHKPRTPHGWEPAEDGWFRLQGQPVRFRLPSAADQLVAETEPEQELIRRCIFPAAVPARWRQRVERAMESLAPRLSRTLCAECPECGEGTYFFFDVQRFVLEELRDQAIFVFRDIHLLALHYKWSESAILALPQSRRIQYAEMLRQDGLGS